MLKIKAWIIIQGIGTRKELVNEKMVFGSRNFRDVKKFLENKEQIFDKNYWRNKRTKRGIIANRNNDWVTYHFHEINVFVP